jgi:hypothetical protein
MTEIMLKSKAPLSGGFTVVNDDDTLLGLHQISIARLMLTPQTLRNIKDMNTIGKVK